MARPKKAAAAEAAVKPAAKKAPAKKPAAKKASQARRGRSGAGQAERAPATAASNSATVTTLPLDDIAASPLNPRKTFSQEAIAELAESIAAMGQLQNISVRKVGRAKPRYHVVFGERRLRAMQALAADGRWPKDAPVTVRVIEADDATHLELAIMENERREDVHPLEQAEAYAKLAALREAETGDAGSATRMVAERTGETMRNVQLYLQVSRNLTADMKQAWTEGLIPTRKLAIAVARHDPALQKEIIEALRWGEVRTEADLKEWLEDSGYPARAAIFDLETYRKKGGSEIELDEVRGTLLASKSLFLELQGKAVEAKAKAGSKAAKLKHPPQKIGSWYYKTDNIRLLAEDESPPDDAFMLYGLDPHTAEPWINIVVPAPGRKGKASDGAAKSPKTSKDAPAGAAPYARRNWAAGGMARTAHLRRLLREDPARALAAAIVALMPRGWEATLIGIRTDRPTGDAARPWDELPQVMPGFFGELPGFEGDIVADRETAMSALLALTREELLSLFAHVIANRCSDVSWTAGPGTKPESLVLVGHIAEPDDMDSPADAAWFGGYTTAQMVAMTTGCGAGLRAPEGEAPPGKKADRAEWMARHRAPTWLPPEARFLPEADMARAVDRMLKGGEA